VLQAKPTQPSILGRAGQTFLAVGLSKRALELIQHGIKFNSESTSIRLLAGRVSLANNQPDEARAMFNEVLKRDPNSAEALVELGRIEAAAGQRDQARKHFAKALELRPADPDLLLLLARVHAQSGDYRKALEYGSRALALFHKARQGYRVQETLVELGRSFRKGDKWAQSRAEELLFEATKPKAAPANAFLELGLLHLQRHDLNRAAWCFKQAVHRDPGYAEGYLRLGQVLAKKTRWRKDARAAFQQYLKLRPKGAEAARVRALLKRLR
jgi:tetratricopeptide (TPR) repeat protein